MFYCEKCRDKNNWPTTLFRSKGHCEVCDKVSVCYERHHSELSIPGKTMEETKEIDDNVSRFFKQLKKERRGNPKRNKVDTQS